MKTMLDTNPSVAFLIVAGIWWLAVEIFERVLIIRMWIREIRDRPAQQAVARVLADTPEDYLVS